jgi:hypothetical protein
MLYTILVAIGGAVVLTWLFRLIVGPHDRSRSVETTNIDQGRGNDNLRKVA